MAEEGQEEEEDEKEQHNITKGSVGDEGAFYVFEDQQLDNWDDNVSSDVTTENIRLKEKIMFVRQQIGKIDDELVERNNEVNTLRCRLHFMYYEKMEETMSGGDAGGQLQKQQHLGMDEAVVQQLPGDPVVVGDDQDLAEGEGTAEGAVESDDFMSYLAKINPGLKSLLEDANTAEELIAFLNGPASCSLAQMREVLGCPVCMQCIV